jgi:tight adherence protein B
VTAVVLLAACVALSAAVDGARAARHRHRVLGRVSSSVAGDHRGAPAARPAVLAAGVAVAAVVVGPAVAIVVAGSAAAARPVGAAWRRRRAAEQADDELPDVVDALARSLRSGAPVSTALRTAGLDDVARASSRGVPVTAAFEQWAAASPVDGAALVATAVAVTTAAGGDTGRSLTAVADTLRERRALRREVRALSSQARMSAVVIAVAPVAFAVVAGGTDGATARFLLRTPGGLVCLVGGLALDAAGWWWMDRITRTVR